MLNWQFLCTKLISNHKPTLSMAMHNFPAYSQKKSSWDDGAIKSKYTLKTGNEMRSEWLEEKEEVGVITENVD